MEGYLWKRYDGGLLGGTAWKRRWCVLEDNYMRAFESFDMKESRTKNVLKSIKVDSTWKARRISTPDRNYTFILTHDTHSSWYLSSETDCEMDLWMSELSITILTSNPRSFDPTVKEGMFPVGFYQTLGMSKDMNAAAAAAATGGTATDRSNSSSSRSSKDDEEAVELRSSFVLTEEQLQTYFHNAVKAIYRSSMNQGQGSSDSGSSKSASTSTNAGTSSSVRERIHVLKRAFYAVHEKHFSKERHDFRHHKYEVTLTKTSTIPGKLGLTFAESPASGWMKVKSIDDNTLHITHIGSAANGKGILIHDALYSINGDIVAEGGWTVSRVAQRLNSICVPPGTSISLVLCRPYFVDSEARVHVPENLSEDYILFMEMTDGFAPPSLATASASLGSSEGSSFSSSSTDTTSTTSTSQKQVQEQEEHDNSPTAVRARDKRLSSSMSIFSGWGVRGSSSNASTSIQYVEHDQEHEQGQRQGQKDDDDKQNTNMNTHTDKASACDSISDSVKVDMATEKDDSSTKRRSLLQRARASLSWVSSSSSVSGEKEPVAVDTKIEIETKTEKTVGAGGSVKSHSHNARANAENHTDVGGTGGNSSSSSNSNSNSNSSSQEAEILQLRQANKELECRVEMYRTKAQNFEESQRKAILELEDVRIDLDIARQEEARQSEELQVLKTHIHEISMGRDMNNRRPSHETHGHKMDVSTRKHHPLSNLGMLEKITRLKNRYLQEEEEIGEEKKQVQVHKEEEL